VAGHLTIALWESPTGILIGCLLIAVGSGGIKPNCSAFAGDQIPKEKRTLLERLYELWYWMINFGSVGSQLAVPWLYENYGPRVAFGTPAVAMALALGIFIAGRRHYVKPPAAGPSPHGFLAVLGSALRRRSLEGARAEHPEWAVEGVRAVFRIGAVFAAVSVFWSLFFQYGSSWTLQADKMRRAVSLGGFQYVIPAGQVQTLDGLFVLALVPILSLLVFPALERRGLVFSPLRRMAFGMFAMVPAFVATALVESALQGGAQVHVAWQIPQYLLLAFAEVLVSMTALEFAYTQAPAQMKSAIMGLWFLTFFAGSLLTSAVAALNRFQGVGFYAFFAVLQLAAAVAFALLARWYPERPAATAGSAAA
jgi:POT family proton-dependent oligopeptide transporter